MKRALTAVAVAALLTACGSDDAPAPAVEPGTTSPAPEATTATPEPPATISIEGVVAIPFDGYDAIELPREDSECVATGPTYSGIEPGVQVQILDQSERIVGTAALGPGEVVRDSTDNTALGCQWLYELDVEAGGKFYMARVLDWKTDAMEESKLAAERLNILPTDLDRR